MKSYGFVEVLINRESIGVFSEPAYCYWLLNTSADDKEHHKACPISVWQLHRFPYFYELVTAYTGANKGQRELIKVSVNGAQYHDIPVKSLHY